MFGIGGQELFFILLLALILLGPSKLPEIMKTLGKAMGEFQRATNDLKKEIDIAAQEKPATPATEPAPAERTSEKQETPGQGDGSPDKETVLTDQPDRHPDEMKG
jgi:sec-independent protein translocase protein TatB